ncbi:MAG: prenyltransferase [Candidatus Omnitrophica bacterium]|nr:prenyltransferase [Candidatus Omnitrophota bacterium]
MDKNFPANFARALRLPFVTASALPFMIGSFFVKFQLNFVNFLLGLTAAVCMHLSANLINDYADSKSGSDWKDTKFYGFFGGSKLIQEKVFTEDFYRRTAIIFCAIAGFSVLALAVRLKSIAIIAYFLAILFLAWAYSVKPLRLCERKLGEPVIFILFGPALVMGGFFIQTRMFPTFAGFLLSLPAGFLVTAILFANEVADFSVDKDSGKFTWVSLLGHGRAYVLYCALMAAAFLSIPLNFVYKNLTSFSLFALLFLLPAIKAASILKKDYQDKAKLVESSRLTILTHASVSIILIVDLLICKKF